MVKISDIIQLERRIFKNPLTGEDLGKDNYMKIADVVDKNITIWDVQPIKNQYGEGASFAFLLDGKAYYSITHGVVLSDFILDPMIVSTLEEPDAAIDCRIVKVPSQKDPSRSVYKLADWDA